MDAHSRSNSQTSLFQVYLRLRPSSQSPGLRSQQTEPWLIVEPSSPLAVQNELGFEEAAAYSKPTHITLQPPNDSRKRAVEKFGFTKVFQEQSSQIEVFEQTGTVELINNILTAGRDGLVATLGVTGSGKVDSSTTTQLYAKPIFAEPYNTRLSFRAWNYSNDFGYHFPIPWLPHTKIRSSRITN